MNVSGRCVQRIRHLRLLCLHLRKGSHAIGSAYRHVTKSGSQKKHGQGNMYIVIRQCVSYSYAVLRNYQFGADTYGDTLPIDLGSATFKLKSTKVELRRPNVGRLGRCRPKFGRLSSSRTHVNQMLIGFRTTVTDGGRQLAPQPKNCLSRPQ